MIGTDFIIFIAIFLTIIVEWIIVFIMTKSGIVYKFQPKPDPKKFSITWDAGGLRLFIPATDPFNAIQNLYKMLTGSDRPIEERIDKMLNDYMSDKISDVLSDNIVKNKDIDKNIDTLIKDKLNKKLENWEIK